MKISISEARRRLPALVKQMQRDPATRIEITVREEPVAELRAVQPHPTPGEAARKLEGLRRRLARLRRKRRPTDIASQVNEHLYGRRGNLR